MAKTYTIGEHVLSEVEYLTWLEAKEAIDRLGDRAEAEIEGEIIRLKTAGDPESDAGAWEDVLDVVRALRKRPELLPLIKAPT